MTTLAFRAAEHTYAERVRYADEALAVSNSARADSILMSMQPGQRHDAVLDHIIDSTEGTLAERVGAVALVGMELLEGPIPQRTWMDAEEHFIVLAIADDLMDVAAFNGRVDVESETDDTWSDAAHVGALMTVLATARRLTTESLAG